MSTHIIITGNCVADPEIKFLDSGTSVATFRVATSSRKKNAAGEWVDGETSYFSCTAFGKAAEAVAIAYSKGTAVVLRGKIESRQAEKNGMAITYFNVTVEDAGVDVRQYLRKPEVDTWQDNSQSPF